MFYHCRRADTTGKMVDRKGPKNRVQFGAISETFTLSDMVTEATENILWAPLFRSKSLEASLL